MSDVFGELIDQTNGAGTDTRRGRWKMGEDLPGIGAIRNMADPTAVRRPGSRWAARIYSPTSTIDSGGVHTNSGVNNKAAFLITDGGTFNGQTVTGDRHRKAARIYYEVETTLLTRLSDYMDLGSVLVQACNDLVGTQRPGPRAPSARPTAPGCVSGGGHRDERRPAEGARPRGPGCPVPQRRGADRIFSDDLENPSGNWARAGRRQDPSGPSLSRTSTRTAASASLYGLRAGRDVGHRGR